MAYSRSLLPNSQSHEVLQLHKYHQHRFHRSLILGSGFLSLLILAVGFLVLLLWYRKRRKTKTNPYDVSSIRLQRFSFRELKCATRSFSSSNRLGKGGFGIVYKGVLRNGKEVAVKRMDSASLQGEREFQNELSVIGGLRCPFIVALLGYCIDGKRRLLVYEHLQNRSLQEALFENEVVGSTLDWDKRFNIILDTAQALSFLHLDCDPPIIHGDIKPSNILLDAHFNAKLADFGLARVKTEADYGPELFSQDLGRSYKSQELSKSQDLLKGVFAAKSDLGEGRFDLSNVRVDSVDVKSDLGEAKFDLSTARLDTVDAKSDWDDARFDLANCRVDSVDVKSDTGESRFDHPNIRVDSVNLKSDLGDSRFAHSTARVDPADVKSELGEARLDHCTVRVDSVDAKSDLGDGRLNVGDVRLPVRVSKEENMDEESEVDFAFALQAQTQNKQWMGFGRGGSDCVDENIGKGKGIADNDGWNEESKEIRVSTSGDADGSGKQPWGKDWWWRQDGSGELCAKDYVMEWIGSQIGKPFDDNNNKASAKIETQVPRSPEMDQGEEEEEMPVPRKCQKREKKHKKFKEWWKEEYFAELNKKSKKPKKMEKKWKKGKKTDAFFRDFYDQGWKDSVGFVKKKKNPMSGSDIWSGDLLSRDVSSTTSMRGTVCYIAPEYGGCGFLSEKGDIYSFGVLILVIVSGRRPLHILASPMKDFEKANLITWARHLAQTGNILDLIDESLRGAFNKDQASLCITLALLCLQRIPELRPDIADVVRVLKGEMDAPGLPLEFSPSPPCRFHPRSRTKFNVDSTFSFDFP